MTTFEFYRLACYDLGVPQTYVGFTENFRGMKHRHKKEVQEGSTRLPIYETIRNSGGFENWDMIFLERKELPREQAKAHARTLLEKTRQTEA